VDDRLGFEVGRVGGQELGGEVVGPFQHQIDLPQQAARVLGQEPRTHRHEAGGLGTVEKHDLGSEPKVTLLEAMREAEGHDRIAWNYTHDFADIFESGIPRLVAGRAKYGGHEWAVTDLYLSLLAKIPDTLIARKFGVKTAAQVTENAYKTLKAFVEAETAEARVDALLTFDKSLKDRSLNPGTTADLTVATLFASSLQANEIGA